MPARLKTVLVQNEPVASNDLKTYDLPIGPLSHLQLTIRAVQGAAEATLADFLSVLERVEVLYKGSAIISVRGSDLFALNLVLLGKAPIFENQVATANAARTLTLVVPFTRYIHSPNECFFATRKGELKLQIKIAATLPGNISSVSLQIETVEILDANPAQYLKVTTIEKVMTSGIENDVDLPIGNVLAGVLLYSPTVPSGASFTATISKLRFLIDNLEHQYATTNWESLHAELQDKVGHLESYDLSADFTDFKNYAFLDFYPSYFEDYLVDTKGKTRVVMKILAGDANTIRALPLELVSAR
jgi:hypothetical protein